MTEREIETIEFVFENDIPISIPVDDMIYVQLSHSTESLFMINELYINDYWRTRLRITNLVKKASFTIKLTDMYYHAFIKSKYSALNSVILHYKDGDKCLYLFPWLSADNDININQLSYNDDNEIFVNIDSKKSIVKYAKYVYHRMIFACFNVQQFFRYKVLDRN